LVDRFDDKAAKAMETILALEDNRSDMLNFFRLYALASILIAATAVVAAQSPQTSQDTSRNQTRKKLMTIRISAELTILPLGSNILVKGSCKNISNKDMAIPAVPLDDMMSPFQMDIRDSQGNKTRLRKPPPSPPYKMEDLPVYSMRFFILSKRTSYDWVIDLTQYFILDHPDKYTVQTLYNDNGKPWMKSNTITITITP
jgi:hypothetical protein